MESTVPDPCDEIATLRRMVAERDAVIAERDTALAGAAIESEHLRIQVATLRRGQFGRSSEKLEVIVGGTDWLEPQQRTPLSSGRP